MAMTKTVDFWIWYNVIYTEDRGIKLLWNSGMYLPNYTLSEPR